MIPGEKSQPAPQALRKRPRNLSIMACTPVAQAQNDRDFPDARIIERLEKNMMKLPADENLPEFSRAH